MTHLPYPANLEELPRHPLPTMYDLPSENPEYPGLPDDFHPLQAVLLLLTFVPPNYDPNLVFSQLDHNIYYDVNHPFWYKRPDWFGVVGVPRLYQGRDLRWSYVIWQEKVSPLIVVELLSPGTEAEDLGQTTSKPGEPPTKWHVYERILRVPYYVIYSRHTEELQIFRLVRNRYRMAPLTEGRLVIPEIELSLGLWRGDYLGRNQLWLRWMTLEGDLIPAATDEATETLIEQRVESAEQRAESAEQRAESAEQRAESAERELEQLKALLREREINPNQ